VEKEQSETLIRRIHPLTWVSSFEISLIKVYRSNFVTEWLALVLYKEEVMGSIFNMDAISPY
jgi:hypothetical protein